jgi:hypothetical protein
MSNAGIGYSAKFAIAGTVVAEVFSITPPNDNIDVIDVSHMQSPNRTREFITGLNDPGEASFEMNFVPGSAADLAIQALKGLTATTEFIITFPPGTTGAVIWTFNGFLTGYEPALPGEDKMTATVTIKVTSSYTTGTAP